MELLPVSITITFLSGLYLLYKMLQSIANKVTKEEFEEFKKKLTPEKVLQTDDPNLYHSSNEQEKIRFVAKAGNKDAGVFHVSKPLYAEGPNLLEFVFPQKTPVRINGAAELGICKEWNIPRKEAEGVYEKLYPLGVFINMKLTPLTVEITKTAALSWDEVIPQVNKVLFDLLEKKNEPQAV